MKSGKAEIAKKMHFGAFLWIRTYYCETGSFNEKALKPGRNLKYTSDIHSLVWSLLLAA